MNFLEQLVAEWYEFQGYFVRRNVNVGRRAKGGYECELDVVAFSPDKNHLVDIEPSMDANSWPERELRYRKKFEAGKAHIPSLFKGMKLPSLEQVALFGYGSARSPVLAGGRVMLVDELMSEIIDQLRDRRVASAAVPETFPLLRAIQFTAQHLRKHERLKQ